MVRRLLLGLLVLCLYASTGQAYTLVVNDSGGCYAWGNAWNGEGVWYAHDGGQWQRGVIVNRDYLPSWFCSWSWIEYGSALAAIVPQIWGYELLFVRHGPPNLSGSDPGFSIPGNLADLVPSGSAIQGPYADGSYVVVPPGGNAFSIGGPVMDGILGSSFSLNGATIVADPVSAIDILGGEYGIGADGVSIDSAYGGDDPGWH